MDSKKTGRTDPVSGIAVQNICLCGASYLSFLEIANAWDDWLDWKWLFDNVARAFVVLLFLHLRLRCLLYLVFRLFLDTNKDSLWNFVFAIFALVCGFGVIAI